MEREQNKKIPLNLKNKLVQFYTSGKLSLVLLAWLLLVVAYMSYQRLAHNGLIKQLSLVPFNTNVNTAQDYSGLSQSYFIIVILLIIAITLIIVYFIAWKFRFKKLNLKAVVVYSLLGFVISSVVYLTVRYPLMRELDTLGNIQICERPAEAGVQKPEICSMLTQTSAQQLDSLGQHVNQTYFITMTAYLAMAFFVFLSILQLLMDRVKKLIVFEPMKKGGTEIDTI